MRATDFLRQQHREIESLFGQLLKVESESDCRSISHEIITLLEIHMTIEESIFYPAYRELSGTREGVDRVLAACEEHHLFDLLVAELPRVVPSSERFEATVTVFKDLVERHIETEECEMFREAESGTEGARLDTIGLQLEERADHLAR